MGHGKEMTCSHCGYETTIKFGVGMRYGGLDDLSDRYFNILHLIDSERIRLDVKKLIEEKNGTIDVVNDSGHALYLCPECEVPYNLFWFKLKHHEGVYEPKYRCRHCDCKLRDISDSPGELDHARCPECLNKGTLSTDNMILINWD